MIGTVIAILGLLVSVATAVVGYRHEQRAERAQQMRDEREEKDRKRREEHADRTERIRQASWISVHVEAGGRRARVYNGSSQPASDVRVLADDASLKPDGARLLMPGGFLTFVHDSEDPGSELDPAQMAVEFTDVAGRTWRRTAAGTLRERISPYGARPQWGTPVTPLVEPYRGPRTDTGSTGVGSDRPFEPSEARRPQGPPSGPLSGGSARPPAQAAPEDIRVPRVPVLRARGTFSWLFVLGCLGAAAALAYLIAQVV
ncbi:hypothetical protein ACIGEZ_32165 [Streptomyces sp. NPDC085481]|uniref:hypothetical protein n=1 Tax=Streptomyces sp. NPDC085481 TaxID=3365727 RepID=UPI0037D1754B